jgi:hypothetical protein
MRKDADVLHTSQIHCRDPRDPVNGPGQYKGHGEFFMKAARMLEAMTKLRIEQPPLVPPKG